MTKEEAFNEFQDFILNLRCGDNSCLFGRYGVGTNGGCRTLKSKHEPRRALILITQKWRELLKEVQNDV